MNSLKEMENMINKTQWNYDFVYEKKDEDGNTIPIPKGYYYVEGNKYTGLVISDSQVDENNPNSFDGNQFVWVPVDNMDEYKLISWNGETVSEVNKENSYYDTSYTTSSGSSSVRGSDVTEKGIGDINDSKNNNNLIKKVSKINSAEDDLGGDAAGLQIKVNERNSIDIYGGFYVGRYELSYNDTSKKVETKKDKLPYSTTYNEFEQLVRNFGSKNLEESESGSRSTLGLDSGLKLNTATTNNNKYQIMSGHQWDAMINWINKTTNNTYNNNGHMGDNKINTGSNDAYKINNIYDIAGNMSEYTQERYRESVATETYALAKQDKNVYRGGNYTMETIKTDLRNTNDGSQQDTIGSRISIILATKGTDQLIQGNQEPQEPLNLLQ